MKYITIIFFICLIGAVGCEQNAVGPDGNQTSESIIEFASIVDIQLVYYDSIQIETKDEFIFNSPEITKIEIGQKSQNQFQLLKTIIPQYLSNEDGYVLILQTGLGIDPEIIDFTLAVRLYSSANKFYELDTLICMYKYPYSDSEIFLTYEDIFRNDSSSFIPINNAYVQDFDFNNSVMFVHGMTIHGIISINTITSAYQEILSTYDAPPACNFLTYGSEYIFFEAAGYTLFRLNLKTDSVDLEFDLSKLNYSYITGLDFYADILYLSMETGQPENNFLAKFDMNGNYLGSISYPKSTWYMTIADNILYALSDSGLSRFDLTSKTFSEDVMCPGNEMDGMRINGNYFYYTDFERRFIAWIHLSDLN